MGDPGHDKLEGEFVFDNGARLQTGSIGLTGKKNKLTLESKSGISDIDFYITDCEGSPVGITELEILPERDDAIPEELREFVFRDDFFGHHAAHKVGMRIENAKLSMKRKLDRWFPNEYVIMRNFPESVQREGVLFPYRFRYVWKRIRSKLGR